MTIKCLAKEHNTMTQPGLEPRPLDPESSVLTTRPPTTRPPLGYIYLFIFFDEKCLQKVKYSVNESWIERFERAPFVGVKYFAPTKGSRSKRQLFKIRYGG